MTMKTAVSDTDRKLLQLSYRSLVKAGEDSVRAGWRFGQAIDSLSDRYTRAAIADALNLSTATIYRYHRFFGVYQRPELALFAAEELETYNIDTLYQLAAGAGVSLSPSRPLTGRHWQYKCTSCGSHEIRREEVTEDAAEVTA